MSKEEEYLDKVFELAHDEYNKDGYEVHIVEILGPYLKKRPEHGQAWLLYGDSLRIIGRSSKALPILHKALEMAPDKEKFHIYGKIGLLYQTYKSPAEAKKWYEIATECETRPIDWLWLLKGSNLAVLEEYESSIACLNKVIGMKSNLKDEAYLNLGLIYRAMGSYEKSIEALKNAIEINPDYYEAQVVLDGLLALKKRITDVP